MFSLLKQSLVCALALVAAGAAGQATRSAEKGAGSTITLSSFGFQCGTGKATNCPDVTWPATIAQPGLIRLWDSQVQWHLLNPGRGNYNWRLLDRYLDAIAAHQPREVMYTFGYTPCWDTKGECERAWGSPYPPDDLGSKGSPTFNDFVNALVDHCSPAGHCVKDTIKYWELWNEANAKHFWGGSVPQLYDLMASAVAIIRSKVPNAVILTPPVSRADTDWMRDWLNQENSKGRLSDIYSFHLYLFNKLPEARFSAIKEMVNLKNNTSGWSDTPWMNTETNFDPVRFACDDNTDACIGAMARWHIIHFAFGARHLGWFFFNTTIGRNPEYSVAYKTMMDWLVGGRFSAMCTPREGVVTCPFIERSGRRALIVWNFRGGSSFTPSPEYRDYKDLAGTTTPLSSGRPLNIGAKPIMLEAEN
ncbi:MAG TPA: hypothetical protein VFA67_11775 [Candidatus Sulfotelmatobacter sp.]|nr:hypothetical protein [Candidatus Sulfotelmatobacter sp.]